MFSTLIARIAPNYNRCHPGHSWTDRADPVACRVCGRTRQSVQAEVRGHAEAARHHAA